MEMRKSDPSDLTKRFFRSHDRFFQINGQWYFSAREGEIGPFRTLQQAHDEARAYVTARQTCDALGAARRRRAVPTVIPGFIYRSVLSMEQQVSGERDMVLDLGDLD